MSEILSKTKKLFGCPATEAQSETVNEPQCASLNAGEITGLPDPEGKIELPPFITFTGTKTIEAVPMLLKDAEKYLGRDIKPATPDKEGFLVRYPDGYELWSPRSVFLASYRVSETFLDRMKIELDELECKILQATKFKFTRDYRNLKTEERAMLDVQLNFMCNYQYALGKRIDYYMKSNE